MNSVLSFESLKLIWSVFVESGEMPHFSERKQYQKGDRSFILICYQEYSQMFQLLNICTVIVIKCKMFVNPWVFFFFVFFFCFLDFFVSFSFVVLPHKTKLSFYCCYQLCFCHSNPPPWCFNVALSDFFIWRFLERSPKRNN